VKPTAPVAQHCDDCRYLHKRADGSGGCGMYHVTLKRYVGTALTEYYRDDVCKADPRSPWRPTEPAKDHR
jgi:hypothetical protein